MNKPKENKLREVEVTLILHIDESNNPDPDLKFTTKHIREDLAKILSKRMMDTYINKFSIESISNIVRYDPDFGDDKVCECGHAYYRHFDTYEDMEPVGCKYCGCYEFREKRDQNYYVISRCGHEVGVVAPECWSFRPAHDGDGYCAEVKWENSVTYPKHSDMRRIHDRKYQLK